MRFGSTDSLRLSASRRVRYCRSAERVSRSWLTWLKVRPNTTRQTANTAAPVMVSICFIPLEIGRGRGIRYARNVAAFEVGIHDVTLRYRVCPLFLTGFIPYSA